MRSKSFLIFYLPIFDTWSALAQIANWASFPRFAAVFPADNLTLIILPSDLKLLGSAPPSQASSTVILPPDKAKYEYVKLNYCGWTG